MSSKLSTSSRFFSKMVRTISPVAACLMVFAAPAPKISQFDVLAVTSARYNPVLPSPLTPAIAVTQMVWDVVPGPSQFKQSNGSHGGGWVAFVTETVGYPSVAYPNGNYNVSPVTYL